MAFPTGALRLRPLAVVARRNGIIAARVKWVTLGEALDGEDGAVEQAVREQAVFGVARARRVKPAHGAEQRRKRPPVDAQEIHQGSH